MKGSAKKVPGDSLHRLFPVGALIQAERGSGVNRAGEIGVVYEQYEIGPVAGVSVLFERGGFDGFSHADIEVFGVMPLTSPSDPHRTAARYRFRSAAILASDYSSGRFSECFNDGRMLADRVLRVKN